MLTASTQALRFIVAVTAAQGIPPPRLFEALDVPSSIVFDPDGRLPLDLLLRAWSTAAKLTANANFGLYAAQKVQVADFGAFGYLVRHSPTLEQAYQRLSRYLGAVNQAVELTIVKTDSHCQLRVRPRSPVADVDMLRHPVECLLGVLMECAHRFSPEPVVAQAVHFRHRAPSQQAEHQRFFGVTPRFAQPSDQLIVDCKLLAINNSRADAPLLPILEKHLANHAQAAPHGGAAPETLRQILKHLLQQGEPTLTRTAAHLRMSPRTLQRQLKLQGTSIQLLLDEVRREIALQSVEKSQLPLAEIAFMLGFSEASAFHRAFKRWSGCTPGELRKRRDATQ
jgi:AraC-like DNA-binding protein